MSQSLATSTLVKKCTWLQKAAPSTVADFTNLSGLGVQGVVDGHAVLAGREALPENWSQRLPAPLAEAKRTAEEAGRTAIAVGWDGAARAVLETADTVKPTSGQAIASCARWA